MWQTYIKGLKLYIPKELKDDLDIFIDDLMNSEMDIVLAIDGKEGTGKSRTARLIGAYIAHKTGVKFDNTNVHLTTKSYINSAENGKKGQVNILDESRNALNKKRTMSKSNVMFSDWLSENRDKHQIHILLLPAIHDLETYITMWRMSLLIHLIKFHAKNEKTDSGYELIRGYFKVYENNKDLQRVIHNKAKFGYYAYPTNYKYRGRFKDCEPFDDEQLKAYKDKKAKERAEKYTQGMNKERVEYVKAVRALSESLKSQKKAAKLLGFSVGKVNTIVNEDIGENDI